MIGDLLDISHEEVASKRENERGGEREVGTERERGGGGGGGWE